MQMLEQRTAAGKECRCTGRRENNEDEDEDKDEDNVDDDNEEDDGNDGMMKTMFFQF